MTDETVETIMRWDPKDNSVWVRIDKQVKRNAAGNDEEVFYAQVILNGVIAGEGECVNAGVNSREKLAERNAISLAMIQFSQNVGKVNFVRVYEPPPASHEPDPGRPRGRVGLERSVLDWGDIFGRTADQGIPWDPRINEDQDRGSDGT